jgi:capsule biosynthesis phosphatase
MESYEMNVIIPIGGIGQRFKDEGYSKPKPLVRVNGEEIIKLVIKNLNHELIENIGVVYNKELKPFGFEDLLCNWFPDINFKFHCLSGDTRGAVETISIGLDVFKFEQKPFLTLDCDTFYEDDIISSCECIGNNAICHFDSKDKTPLFSYITIDDGKIKDIAEKDKISDNANTGCYCFVSPNTFQKYSVSLLKNELSTGKEFYVSTLYKKMLNDGADIFPIEVNKFHCLGTPLQVKMYCNEIDSEQKRICFDLDNTLVTYPKVHGDYTTVEAIEKNIQLLRYMKSKGNHIIIYTARRMKTHSGNIGALVADIGQITIDTLTDFDIPYDELVFGKPYAHVYIDDLTINPYVQDVEKEVGFYNTTIVPRDFNQIETKEDTVVKRSTSSDMHGEIYWYNNIPQKIEHLFPKVHVASDDFLEIEKINGLTYSYLLTNGMLMEKHIDVLFDTMNEIHSIGVDDDVDLYYNYGQKVIDRFLSYDYKFEDASNVFREIVSKLKNYDVATKATIHGDLVFTNIIYDDSSIKLIDMRGKLGDKLTLAGDMFYDYAKAYQSLNGYDCILLDKEQDTEHLKEYFERKFEVMFGEEMLGFLKVLTASLFFSLIPLHDNKKCEEYYIICKGLIK